MNVYGVGFVCYLLGILTMLLLGGYAEWRARREDERLHGPRP
jgi:hypothetical protein